MTEGEQRDGLVGLGAAIEALRAELSAVMAAGAGTPLRFRPGPVELTVQATVTRTAGGKAGLKWWLLEAGVEGSIQSATTQTLKLVLQPVDAAEPAREPLLSGPRPDAPARDGRD